MGSQLWDKICHIPFVGYGCVSAKYAYNVFPEYATGVIEFKKTYTFSFFVNRPTFMFMEYI